MIRHIALLLMFSALTGCGKKGDLLPPNHKPASTQPAPKAPPHGTPDPQQ